jgi:glutathione synthase/RimK-type ligase-like ATP-grasp enzyme
MIAIHNSKYGFHSRWIEYCQEKNIQYKLVNCYSSDIISQLKDCNALMWHFRQSYSKDIIMGKELLFSLEQSGFNVFPNYNTAWHFNDKLGQKYLFEALNIPHVPTHVFYNKNEAENWIKSTNFPKVIKLRGGAGSANVKLIRNKQQALKSIKRAFRKGFKQYDKFSNLQERWNKYKIGKTNLIDVIKGIIRLGYEPEFSKTIGFERGYILLQDFIPNNDYDIRIIVIGDKAFAIKRLVRKNDFRASGSGNILYSKDNFDDDLIKLSFSINEKLNSQSLAIDYVFDNGIPIVVECSYGFVKEAYDSCPGYWDKNLNWYKGKFNPYGWMVENLINSVE